MKAFIKTALLTVAIASCIALLKSCAKNTAMSTSCQAPSDLILNTKLDASFGITGLNTELFFSHAKNDECEIAISNSVEVEKFTKLTSSLSSILHFTETNIEKSIGFTLFINGELQKDNSVSLNSITGVSRFFTKGDKLYHQLFLKKSGTQDFQETFELYGEVDGVIFNYMHLIGRNIISMPEKSTAYFIKSEEAKGLYEKLKNPHDDLKWKIKVYLKLKQLKSKASNNASAIASKQIEDLEANCGNPCTQNNGSVCRNGDLLPDQSARCGPKAAPINCLAVTIFSFLTDNYQNNENIPLKGGGFASLPTCINLDQLRQFRDSILYQSQLGISYINNYYLLSDRFLDSIDLTLALESASVAFDVNSRISALMNPSSNQNIILIDSNFKNELVALINLYKSKTTDPTVTNILDTIISDITNTFQGKTISEIRALLNI